MMSTPISNIRSREDDREDDLADLAEDFGEGDSDLSVDEDEVPRYSRGPSRTYTNPIADDVMEDDIQPVRSPPRAAAVRSPRRRRRVPRDSVDLDDEPDEPRPRSRVAGFFSNPLWSAVFSRAFLQAIVLSFVIVLAVSLSPLASMLLDRVPAISKVPCANAVLTSLITAVLVTATRPPCVARM